MIVNPVTLGEKLRNRRLELGLSQGQVAKILETDLQYVYAWENNHNKPIISKLPKIIKFLGYFPFDFDTMSFGGKLKKYRYIHGLSQRQVSKLLNVDSSVIRHFETKSRQPMTKHQRRIFELIEQVD